MNELFIFKFLGKDFELLNQINTQIQDIKVKVREIEDEKFKNESGFDIFLKELYFKS